MLHMLKDHNGLTYGPYVIDHIIITSKYIK